MKKLFYLIAIMVMNIFIYPQQPQDSIFVIISGDTVNIWNTGALANCASAFRLDVAFSADTIFVIEVDTTDMYVPCLCYFNLCSSITGLQNGFYNVKVFRDLPLIFPDTLLYIGSTSFTYAGLTIPFITNSYQSDCDPITSIKENSSAPDEFELFQNYPNPFNPSTKISWQIPASLNPSKGGTLVTLKVYDILGSEIATLVNEEKPAGTYEVEFDASYLSSGIYFYQLTAGEFIQTKRMVFLR